MEIVSSSKKWRSSLGAGVFIAHEFRTVTPSKFMLLFFTFFDFFLFYSKFEGGPERSFLYWGGGEEMCSQLFLCYIVCQKLCVSRISVPRLLVRHTAHSTTPRPRVRDPHTPNSATNLPRRRAQFPFFSFLLPTSLSRTHPNCPFFHFFYCSLHPYVHTYSRTY